MRYSKLFGKTLKEAPGNEAFASVKLLVQAGFIEKTSAGVYSYLPLGLKVLKKIEAIIRKQMEKLGGQEVLMPVLHPKKNWEQTGRWQNLDVLFRLKSLRSSTEYALGPTHEEIVTPLAAREPLSYKDLPFGLFQIQTKFRDEMRPKSGLIRGREFDMKDLYSFHANEKDLDNYYQKAILAYKEILEKLRLAEVTYLTYASGGTFSQYSHEFQTLAKAGEDTIYLCEKCKIAVNGEIFAEQSVCPKCKNKSLKKLKSIEIANIFKLKTKFSKAFNLTFNDKDNQQKLVLMGCYGFGPSRAMATIVEVRHDERGVIWPESVAPYAAHLVAVSGRRSAVSKFADKVYNELVKAGIEVLYDEREDVSAGEKFADADLIGIPVRLVVSEKTLRQSSGQAKIEWKDRDKTKTELLTVEQVMKKIISAQKDR